MKNTTIIPKSRRNILKYFIFVFFIIPTIQVSGLTIVVSRFIPNPLGYNLLAFILSLPFLCGLNKKYGNLKGVVRAITLLVIYIILKFLVTVWETSFLETLTVFRYSYMQAINLFILLPFIFKLRKEEVDYILNCIFKCLILFIVLYLSNNLGFDWMGVKGGLVENVGGVSADRSIIGMPLFDPIWTALLVVYTMKKVPKANRYLMLILLTLVISFTRNLLFSTIIITAVVMMLGVFKNPNNFKRSLKLLLILVLGVILICIVMPNAVDFWMAKLANTFSNDIKYDVGTLAFRERLIEDAIYAIRHNPLFGLGYIRDVAKGEYSMVTGGDTYIAPILWCEGWIGLVLRILPFVVLGMNSILNVLKKKNEYWLDIVIVAVIVAASINYIQTKALTNYPLILGIIILLKIKDYYDRKTQDFGNYSIL